MALAAGTRLGSYELLELLGVGGMGEVYRARDPRLSRDVALKILPAELAAEAERLERFEREARTLAALNHPNIVTIFSVEEADDLHFLTMERVEGQTLSQVIPRGGLPLSRFFRLAIPLTEAVSAAHEKGVTHRDLKPGNVMVTNEDRIKVLDFGLAKLGHEVATEDSQAPTLPATQEGLILGTVPYMSPEQVHGRPVGPCSDVFSLGIMLYEMVTGDRPFHGETSAELALSILKDTPASVTVRRAHLPRDLGRLIDRCLEKEPRERYQSTVDLSHDLVELRGEVDTGDALTSTGAPIAARRAHGRRRAWILGGAIAATLALAGGYVLTRPLPGPPPTGPASAEPKRLVVFPFENLGAAEDDYFAAGMTEEIRSRLAGVRALAVASRTTASEYDRTGKRLRTIGSELDVDYVLEGTVRWSRSREGPGRVRITPRLIRVADDTSLWTATYEREMTDVFALQSDVAGKVVRALGESLSPEEARAFAAVPTRDLTAYDLYLQAYRIAEGSLDPRHLGDAIRLLSEAVQRDPQFAEAHAILAQRHLFDYWFYRDRSPACLERARRAAERAVALAPDAPETHLALGYYYYMGHLDYERALEETRIALRLRPDDSEALALQAFIHRRAGRPEETVRLLERALIVDSGSALKWLNLGETYWLLRRYPEAERALERALALNPRWGRTYSWRAGVYLCRGGSTDDARALLSEAPAPDLQEADMLAQRLVELDMFDGRYDQAVSRLRSADREAFSSGGDAYVPVPRVVGDALRWKGDPAGARQSFELALRQVQAELEQRPDDPQLFGALGLVHAGLGHRDEALRAAQTAVDLMPISREALLGTLRAEELARVHALVGDPETAIDILEDLLARPSLLCLPLVRLDPAWDPLRSHPRFKELIDEDGQTEATR